MVAEPLWRPTPPRYLGGVFLLMALFAMWSDPAAGQARGAAPHYQGISRQHQESTCGLAALATLMRTWGGDERVTEKSLLRAWRPTGPARANLLRDGLTRADLIDIVRAWGSPFLPPRWLAVTAADLANLPKPVIVLVRPRGSPVGHFVVLKGVRDGKALLADPILGHVAEPADDFVSMWAEHGGHRGLVLVVDRADGLALAASALRLPGDKGAVTRHVSTREAALRRQAVLARGTTVWSLTGTSGRVLDDGLSSAAVALPTHSLELDVQWGLSDTLSLRLGAQVATASRRELGRRTSLVSGTSLLTVETSWLAREERDDGSPSLVLSGGLNYEAGSRRLAASAGVRAERNWNRASIFASVSVDGAIRSSGPPGNGGAVTARLGYSSTGGSRLLWTGAVGMTAGTEAGATYLTPTADIGVSLAIAPRAILSTSVGCTLGRRATRTISIGVAIVR
jgi:predicted double-glycine peptidase